MTETGPVTIESTTTARPNPPEKKPTAARLLLGWGSSGRPGLAGPKPVPPSSGSRPAEREAGGRRTAVPGRNEEAVAGRSPPGFGVRGGRLPLAATGSISLIFIRRRSDTPAQLATLTWRPLAAGGESGLRIENGPTPTGVGLRTFSPSNPRKYWAAYGGLPYRAHTVPAGMVRELALPGRSRAAGCGWPQPGGPTAVHSASPDPMRFWPTAGSPDGAPKPDRLVAVRCSPACAGSR